MLILDHEHHDSVSNDPRVSKGWRLCQWYRPLCRNTLKQNFYIKDRKHSEVADRRSRVIRAEKMDTTCLRSWFIPSPLEILSVSTGFSSDNSPLSTILSFPSTVQLPSWQATICGLLGNSVIWGPWYRRSLVFPPKLRYSHRHMELELFWL